MGWRWGHGRGLRMEMSWVGRGGRARGRWFGLRVLFGVSEGVMGYGFWVGGVGYVLNLWVGIVACCGDGRGCFYSVWDVSRADFTRCLGDPFDEAR
ncbi:unnamed protein product [Dovyalis caffra]|uniref:Transmembrane protein n=1 Tax=Dovyalis caffra TaxID=77055 RepID=A0AAV1QSQ7_9ROSI|nr:unnamed protein product [Dovyalis caffra]